MLSGKITDTFRQAKSGSAPDRKLSSRLKASVRPDATAEDLDDKLRQFDLTSTYGPSLGISRIARWERAQKLGLNPPDDIICLLRNLPPDSPLLNSVFENRV
eukprot:jgi/Botrbrau1/20883/Bobra.0135s0014.2